jgi:hypothetical protein
VKGQQLQRVFTTAIDAFRKNGVDIKDKIISQGFLRLEVALNTANSTFDFPVLENDRGQIIFNTEQRLKQQDSFFISEMAVFVCKPVSANDSQYPLVTYPSPTIFSGANTAKSLETVYNGKLNLDVNNRTILAGWDLQKHKFVPRTQATAAANSPLDQYDGAVSSYHELLPSIVLIGSKSNVLQLRLPTNLQAVEPNSRLVLLLRGVLAQNTTVVS